MALQNRLVVSGVEMTVEPLPDDPARPRRLRPIADISGTIEGAIDFVDPEAIERARALREDLRFPPRRTPDSPEV